MPGRAKVVFLSLLWLLSLSSWSAFSQDDSEARFEGLCREFAGETSPSARQALLDFAHNVPQSPLSTLAYYLVGYRDLQKGDLESALDRLENALVGADQVPIADFIHYHHTEVLHKLNRPARAIEGWQTYLRRFPRSHFSKQAIRHLWAEALLLGDPQLIFQSQADWTHLAKSTEGRYYAAAAHELVGDTRQAIDRYLRLHYRFPLSPASSKVLAALNRLRLDYPEESFEVPPSWKKVRAEKLFKGKQYGKAIKALEVVLETASMAAERSKLLLWKGIAEFHSRKQQNSLRTLKALPVQFPQQPQAWFYEAENYRRLDDYASFQQTVKKLQQRYPRSSWLEKAWFSLGNSRLVKRELEQANGFYQQIIDQFSSGPRVTNAHWRVAWYHYRKRNREKALSLFIDHLQRFSRSNHRPSALYWSARSMEYSGHAHRAKLLYQAITEVFSNHYYARLSKGHLNRLKSEDIGHAALDPRWSEIVARLKRRSVARFSSDASQVPRQRGRFSARVKALGLIQLFQAAAREFLRTNPGSRATQLQAATLYHQGSHFPSSTYYLRRLFPGYVYRPFASLPEELWRMLFPIKYAPLFSGEAQKHGLDPYLLVALVRQESVFAREALSPAKARGIMQLMPTTAKRVARQLKVPSPSRTQLYDPPLNIRLGSQYFADRLEQFNGEVDQALASYNAGPDRVTLWLNEGNYREPAEFVENIPFTETRNYVKIIHRNYWFYKRLYGDAIWQ